MSATSTSPQALDAFARAVADDYADRPRYPAGSVFMDSEVEPHDFVAAVMHRDPLATTIVFVRADGAEMLFAPRPPKTIRERLSARMGRPFFDITVRPSAHDVAVYHDARYTRQRDIVAIERRSFALA